MKTTKLFRITFDEPCSNRLCAENLAVALHAYCQNTHFDVREIEPLRPEDNQSDSNSHWHEAFEESDGREE